MTTKTNEKPVLRPSLPPLPAEPMLRFTPYARAKFHWLCHRGPSEIGAFALTDADDLLRVTDLLLVKQEATVAGVKFDDEAVADLFDEQVDAGIVPERFARIWLHTHPGHGAEPSNLDESTFARVFGRCHWAVMAILARGGAMTARLRFNVGPGGEVRLPIGIDYGSPFAGSDHDAWEADYRRCVTVIDRGLGGKGFGLDLVDLDDPMDDLGEMDDDDDHPWPGSLADVWENGL